MAPNGVDLSFLFSMTIKCLTAGTHACRIVMLHINCWKTGTAQKGGELEVVWWQHTL